MLRSAIRGTLARALVAGVVIALALPATGCIASAVATQPAGEASDFVLRDLSGREVHLSDYLGTDVILLDFWSTFCAPCTAELPHLEEIYQADKDRGFVILAISTDGPDTAPQVPSFAVRYHLTFPVLIDSETTVQAEYDPAKAMPYSVLIDRAGHVVKERQGYTNGDERFVAADVERLLGATSAK